MNWESFKFGSKNYSTIISSYQSTYCYHESKSQKDCWDIVLSQQKLFVCCPGKYSISQNTVPHCQAEKKRQQIVCIIFMFKLTDSLVTGHTSCHAVLGRQSSVVVRLVIMYPYQDKTRHIRSNITLCLKELPRAKPEGTPEGKGLYLTVYPEFSHNTDIISFKQSLGLCLPRYSHWKIVCILPRECSIPLLRMI